MSGQYDFREGMLLEKVVYKDDSCKAGEGFLYFGCLLLTWCWGMAWFALFFWMYIFHENIAFWIFIGVWLIHFIIIVIVGAYTLIKSKNDKIKKKQLKEERAEQEKKIEDARKKRQHPEKLENYNQNNVNINVNENNNINNNNNLENQEENNDNNYNAYNTEIQTLK